MRIVLVQLASTTDSAANREAVTQWADRIDAAGARPDLVVLPEGAMHDFGTPDTDLAAVAEPLDGPYVDALGRAARRLGATVVAGMFERREDGLPFNTLVVVDSDASVVAAYRKIHLYDSFGYAESERLSAGELTPVVVDVGGTATGLMTCYDLRFPEMARRLIDCGAELLVVPSAWVSGPLKEDHWRVLLQARAIENTVHVAAAGQTGRNYIGLSAVVDPMGVVISAAGAEEALVEAVVERERMERARSRNPSLSNRRLDVPVSPA
jgi:predicted amidohydrolase